MDVFPYDIGVAEAYDFNWHPRPVFQSFSAYTEYLDSLNAKYYMSASSPEYILYALGTIDSRYEIFDEPATFRTLLLKYEPCALDRNFIVLHKKDAADIAAEEYAGTEIVKFGETIPVPKCSDGLLFAKIHIEHNLPGMVRKILYKSPDIYVTLFNNDTVIGTKEQKFVFSNAANGLFVSQYISDQNSLLEVWKGNIQQDITSIVFQTKYPEFFKDKITVEFFKITKKSN
jgi:hypothetical protein